MNISEKAARIHKSGCNCAQSVFAACADECGIDENTAISVSTGFGGGMKCGEVCGAISGGVMAIGYACTHDAPQDPQAKTKSMKLCKELIENVREKYGVITCRDLKAQGHMVPCDEIIDYCAIRTEEILEKNK